MIHGRTTMSRVVAEDEIHPVSGCLMRYQGQQVRAMQTRDEVDRRRTMNHGGRRAWIAGD